MAINTQKFLPSSKGGAKVAKISKGSVAIISEKSQKNIGIIKVKVIEIDKLLKGTIASQKKELDIKRKEGEKKRFSELESKLETKPKAEKGKIKMPKVPRMGFLDWIKNFIGNIILGYFAVRLVDQLPKLKGVISFIGKASDFVLDIGGKLLDGLVTFIDWGYKAYDATRGFMKNLFGEGGAKQFDELSGLLNKFLNLAIIAGMLSANSGGSGGGRNRGRNGTPRPKPGERFRPKVTESGGRRAGSGFDVRNPLRERPTITEGRGGRSGFRLPEFFGGKPRAKVTVGGPAERGLFGGIFNGLKGPKAAGALKFVGRGLEAAALIPTVFEVVGLVKQKKYKDAVRTIISAGLSMAVFETVLGATGAAAIAEEIFTGGAATPAAIATLFGGVVAATASSAGTGYASDELLKKLGLEDKPKRMLGGGTAKGQKRRTLNTKKGKYKRKLAPRKPGQIEMQPGADVGGEDKIFGLFPNPLKAAQNAIDMMNPFKVIENTGKELGKSDYFGPILAITSKILLGQKPTQKDYENVGLGINLLVSKGLNEGKLKGGLAAAFAEGGFVDPKTLDAISQSGDISDWVAKSFKESTENNAQKTLREIQDNLRLKGPESEKPSGPGTGPGSEDTGAGGMELNGNLASKSVQLSKKLQQMFGLKDFQAAAIVGTWLREGFGSGFPDIKEGGKRGAPEYNAPQSKGYGFAQWTNTQGGGPNDRLNRALIYLGMKDNPRPWTVEDNLKVFKWEIEQKGYGSAISELKKTTNLTDAVRTFVGIYEAGGMRNIAKYEGQEGGGFIDRRLSSAKGVLKYMTSGKDDQGKPLETASFSGEGAAGTLGGSGKFIQGNSGASRGVHFHIGPGSQVKGTILQSKYNADARSTAAKVVDYFIGKGSRVYDGRRGVYYKSGKEVGDAQRAHTASGSQGGIDLQVDYEKPVPFPLQTTGMAYRPNGFGVSADILGSNSFVAHGRYDEKGRKAPQEGGLQAYAKGGETLAGPHLAMLGEKGSEIVVDADSSGPARDMLLAINQAKDHKGVMKAIQQYAPYDAMSPQTIVMPSSGGESDYDSEMSGGGVMMMGGDEGDSYDPFDALEMGG